MPTGMGEVVPYLNPVARAMSIAEELKQKEWFGFGEVHREVPQVLWGTFAEMPPFFYNKEGPVEAVPQHMQNYLKRTERARSEFSEPIGALSAKTFLDYAPLLEWYLDHGAVLTKVHRTINYVEGKPFVWFVDEVTAARRMRDADKSKALLPDIFKLLGNSAPGKMIENLERQTRVIYTKVDEVINKSIKSAFFSDIERVGEAHEIKSRKTGIVVTRLFQVGILVYQLVKKRMLEFYYDSL